MTNKPYREQIANIMDLFDFLNNAPALVFNNLSELSHVIWKIERYKSEMLNAVNNELMRLCEIKDTHGDLLQLNDDVSYINDENCPVYYIDCFWYSADHSKIKIWVRNKTDWDDLIELRPSDLKNWGKVEAEV